MKVAKVTKHESVNDGMGYAEISQSQNTQQALLIRDSLSEFTRMTGYVKCRDFLVDSYSFQQVGRKFGIYGFSFDGSKHKLDWDSCNIELKFAGKGSRENFIEHVKQIIHPIEKANKYDLTTVMAVEDSTNLVAVGDKRWLQNCLSFSFWSLLLRVCCYDFDATKDWIAAFSKKQASDAEYIKSIPRETLDKVMADLSLIKTEEFCGFDAKKQDTGTIHHNSGFVSIFGWHTEICSDTVQKNKHWKEMQKRGLKSKVVAD